MEGIKHRRKQSPWGGEDGGGVLCSGKMRSAMHVVGGQGEVVEQSQDGSVVSLGHSEIENDEHISIKMAASAIRYLLTGLQRNVKGKRQRNA